MTKPLSTSPFAGQRRVLAARRRVGAPARVFREHLAAGDLAGVWDGIDVDLRLDWTGRWARTRGALIRGMCPDQLARELASAVGPSQPWWPAFEQDQIRGLREIGRAGQQDPSQDPALLPTDIVILYADPRGSDVWALPNDSKALPMLMRWNGTTWRVLNYGASVRPRPAHAARKAQGRP